MSCQVSQATSQRPAVRIMAPASSTPSAVKKPRRTTSVPTGTHNAAQRAARLSGVDAQTSAAISAAAKPANWKWATVSDSTRSGKSNSG